MTVWRFFSCALFAVALSSPAFSQIDGSNYDPQKDANIDLYIKNWNESEPRTTHGLLVEHEIFTRGNQLAPPRKGAVLEYVNRFSHATLNPGVSTKPVTLTGEQEIFYIVSGNGILKAGGTATELHQDLCVLVPEGLEFIIAATGTEPLTAFLISEPVPDGFTPNKEIVAHDNNTFPFSGTGHWSYQEKDLLLHNDGLGILHAVITLTLDPMTIGHPHTHIKGCEEVWTTIRGNNYAWLGKQLREQPPGTAYMIPPDDKTNHSNINPSRDEKILMLYFSVRQDMTK